MSRKKTIILAFLLLAVGFGVMLYPIISNYINQLNGSYAIQNLQNQMEHADSDEMIAQRRLAETYNKQVFGTAIGDAFDSNEDSDSETDYYDILDFGDGIMGYIQIPKINVNLPIYHGVSDEVLAKGVGHMPQTAFPIGGKGNHTVLTGHTGLPSAELFTNLTELEKGDIFYINILEETLAYQVDQIKVTLPNEVEDLAAVYGKDYCTLVTCTPYGINSHRLHVCGERIDVADIPDEQLPENVEQEDTVSWKLALVLILVVLLLVVVILMIYKRRKKR